VWGEGNDVTEFREAVKLEEMDWNLGCLKIHLLK
jgi:hypothetical protein